jgi:AcrR family transcriptional regulator
LGWSNENTMKNVSERKREALDRIMREAACQATIEVLHDFGLEGLTMERVAKVAGVAKGTLYNYFNGKQALLEHVLEGLAGPMLVVMQEMADGDLPADRKLAEVVAFMLASAEENRETFRLLEEANLIRLHHGSCAGDGRGPDDHPQQRARRIIREVIREGVEAGLFRDIPTGLAAEYFFATLTVLKEAASDDGVELPLEERVALASGMFLRGVATA